MIIEVGDTVEVPKGTIILDGSLNDSLSYFRHSVELKISARKSKVKVEGIIDASARWWNLLDEAEHDEIYEKLGIRSSTFFEHARGFYPDDNGPVEYSGNRHEGRRWTPTEVEDHFVKRNKRVPLDRQPEADALLADLKARVEKRYGDMQFIAWSNYSKATLVKNVIPAEAVAKKPKEAKITKRRLMLPGARFKFTHEVEVHIWIDNPEIDRLVKERDSHRVDRNSQHRQGSTMVVVLGGGREQTKAELDAMARIQEQINAQPRQVNVLAAKVPAGVMVEITDKPEASSRYYGSKESNGLMVPLKVIADGPICIAKHFLSPSYWNPLSINGNIALPYSQIEKAIEVVEGTVPENIVWALRDRESGEYFGGWETERRSYGNRQTNTPKLSATFSGAKKYKNLSAVKASIMDFTGYHAGLEQEDYVEEWVGGTEKKMDLPETWEAVAVDKTTNTEKRVEDVVDWYAGLMRLRVLTAQFGSALRGVYKKVEKKEGYEAIVVFKLDDTYDPDDPHLIRETRLVREAVEASGAENIVSNSTQMASAYAVKDQTDATMMLLAYQGSGTAKAFDIATLQEIVPEAADA